MNPQTTTQHTYAPLDTYSALLLNEAPGRREDVTEIQDREAGDLLCYANPQRAELICRAVNSHAQLVAALENTIEAYRIIRPQIFGTDIIEQKARRALSLAKGEA